MAFKSIDSISFKRKGRIPVRIGETSIHSLIFIQILVIDLDWTYLNEPGRLTVCRFGISIHDSIIQYQTRKSHAMRISETTIIRCDGC